MRAMLPVSVIDIRGPTLGQVVTSMLNYFNLIVYLISNQMLWISNDLFTLLEIALGKRSFLSFLRAKTPMTRAFIQTLFRSAIRLRRTKVISILLDAGLVFDAWTLHTDLPLKLAIEGRETTLASRLVRAGANLTGDLDSRALANAAAIGDLELVSLLTDMGADVNPQDTSTYYPALLLATKRGDVEMVKLLLSRGADINVSCSSDHYILNPLARAARRGGLQLVQLFLDRGVHVEDRGRIQKNALALAADRGHLELAKVLLDAGAELNRPSTNGLPHIFSESSALYAAVERGCRSVAELLLRYNADPNIRLYSQDDPEPIGKTALFAAVSENDAQMTQLLLKAGAHVDDMNLDRAYNGNLYYIKETAISRAVRYSRSNLVRILLDAGAVAVSFISDVRIQHKTEYRDNFAYNTLDLAIRNSEHEIALLLIAADPSVTSLYKDSLFYSAIRMHDVKLVRFFLDAGADINHVPIES